MSNKYIPLPNKYHYSVVEVIPIKPVQTGFSHVLVSVVIHVHRNQEYIMVQLHVLDQKYLNG